MQRVELRMIEKDAWQPISRLVAFRAVNRQVLAPRTPAVVARQLAVAGHVGGDIEWPHLIDAPHQPQLFQIERSAVAWPYRRAKPRVSIGFGTFESRLRIGVDPIEDRIGDVRRHTGQSQQSLPAGVRSRLIPFHKLAEMQFCGLVHRAESKRDLWVSR